MANIKSAKKRARQANKRSIRNVKVRSALKTQEKKLSTALRNTEKQKEKPSLSTIYRALDIAVKHGVIHKNSANRKKALFAKLFAGAQD